MTLRYLVLSKYTLSEISQGSGATEDVLKNDIDQAAMRNQYVMWITDDKRWWYFIAHIKFSSEMVFEEVKKELRYK